MTNLTQRLEAKAAQMESKGYKELADLLREAVKEIRLHLSAAQDMCVDMEQAKRERDAISKKFDEADREIEKSNEGLMLRITKQKEVISRQYKENQKLTAEIDRLEQESKRESMELRSRLGSALGRNSEMVEQLAKAKNLFAEVYQVAGVHDASELVMDILSDAVGGNFRVDELLPYYAEHLEREQAKRDLEQQAMGVESIDVKDFVSIALRHCDVINFQYNDVEDAFKYIAKQLRQQAKGES